MGKRAGRRSKSYLDTAEKAKSFRSLGTSNSSIGTKLSVPATQRKTLELAASKIEGGRRFFVEYVRMALDMNPDVKPFIDLWDSQTEYQQEKMTLDEFSNLSGVKSEMLVSAAAAAAYRYNADVSDLMAMTAMPSVIRKGIEEAKGDSKFSWKDREMLYKHAKFLPMPQGYVVNISNSNAAMAQANSQAGSTPFSETVNMLSDSIRDAWVPPEGDEG